MSKKKFRVVLADPPWDVQQKGTRGAQRHYRLMSVEAIARMPVVDLVEDDATLFLWTTSAALPFAFQVMQAWGFEYKSHAIWDKYYIGLGQYFRSAHEVLLHGTRGKAPWKFHGQRSTLLFPRMEHSVKPSEIFTMIERVLDGPYLELFARRRPPTRGDWSVWGNEVVSDVQLADAASTNTNRRGDPTSA